MPTLESRLDRLEKRHRASDGLDLPTVIERALESPGVAPEDRQRLNAMAIDWRSTGGKEFARLMTELADESLDVLGKELKAACPGRPHPREHAGLFLSLANDPELSADERQTCRDVGEQLRAGRIDLESALAEVPDAALARAESHRIHIHERRWGDDE